MQATFRARIDDCYWTVFATIGADRPHTLDTKGGIELIHSADLNHPMQRAMDCLNLQRSDKFAVTANDDLWRERFLWVIGLISPSGSIKPSGFEIGR